MENALKPIIDSSDEETLMKNKIRMSLVNYFRNRNCYTLIRLNFFFTSYYINNIKFN